ncbi:uncharacterized protein LOC125492945 [Beta vulgaris subsp. vulgaris]|uniref:uncharacterized protein LOC125492945 n=1 Tax=Beta vulgaris subsp. vulgaris TaxID=3555 RepID=UPI0020375D36|nr:uncharacterized protein LOC125492945 [Beta vulgaris subsp. vulgaris]
MRGSAKKARHNKVYTAKGPRDRRVRLSADIAIQFYDVQDRLGYERATEAVDWLMSKARGSIDKLFETSSQQLEHLTNLGAQNSNTFHGDYLVESSMSGREDYGVASFHHNCTTDGSMFFPCYHMENGSQDQCNADHSSFSASPCLRCLERSRISYFQQIDDGKGQIPRMFMFNSKLSLKNEEHPFLSNSVPLFLQPSEIKHYNDLSSVHIPSDPDLSLCLPANCLSSFHDSEQYTTI